MHSSRTSVIRFGAVSSRSSPSAISSPARPRACVIGAHRRLRRMSPISRAVASDAMARTTAPSAAEPSVFTRIIAGEIPGRFVWRDPDVVAFLTIAPMRPGHTLVVPVRQVDHWTDLDAGALVRAWRRAARRRPGPDGGVPAGPGRFDHRRARGAALPRAPGARSAAEADLNFARADPAPDPGRHGRRRRAHPSGAASRRARRGRRR